MSPRLISPDDGSLISGNQELKCPKPKILLLDVEDSAVKALKSVGLNVSVGTLGAPYKVARNDGYQPIISRWSAPNHAEQEVAVIDFLLGEHEKSPRGEKHTTDGQRDLWAKCTKGFIDPRIRAVTNVNESFNRIFDSGGIFVIFAAGKTHMDVVTASCYQQYGSTHLEDKRDFNYDVWNILHATESLTVRNFNGEEMSCVATGTAIGVLVEKHLDGARYECTIDTPYDKDPWIDLVHNKFQQAVGVFRNVSEGGLIVILPQIADKTGFLRELFTHVLPELKPKIFPFNEGNHWLASSIYELSNVTELKLAQAAIRKKADNEIAALDNQIASEQAAHRWMRDLLTATGKDLEEAVKTTLLNIGFKDVVDVDEKRDGDGESRREDLQINDLSPVLIVDIKGLGGFPADSDAAQSHKHAVLRMKEWERFDVQPLTIINHQRYMAPLDRDNLMPFRKEILDHAGEMSIGLMTSWDLYRLVRSANKWNWPSATTMPILYKIGRIDPVPIHYAYIGKIAHVWSGAMSIEVEAIGFRVGDRIAYEFDVEFEEEEVVSLQIDKNAVDSAEPGSKVGVSSKFHRPIAKDGVRVFLVQKQA